MSLLAEAVYFFCALSSLVCAILLIQVYRRRDTRAIISRSFASAELLLESFGRSGNRILLWASFCFLGLVLNNLLLLADIVFLQNQDLSVSQGVTGLVGVSLFLFGLIFVRE